MIDVARLPRDVLEWWHRTVWAEASSERPWIWKRFLVYVRAGENAIRSYERDHIPMRAHALTFRTLLGLVPFLAVAFSLFQAFGGLEASEQRLQETIIANLAPGSASIARDYIHTFVGRISAGAIGGVGVIVLFLTVVSLLTYIEQSFNAMWKVGQVRPFFSRFVTYWAMVTVGPVLLALSFSMTSAARSQIFVSHLDEWFPGGQATVELLFRFVPWVFTWVGMTLLYQIVPNTRVRWRAAVGGGVLAGTLWEVGKLAFTWASARLFSYSAVYGSFGALPVFLLWIQIGWTIVLLGCKVTYGLQYSRALQDERAEFRAGPAVRELLALRSMLMVARAYVKGLPPPTTEELAASSPAPLGIEKEILNQLVRARLLLSTPDDAPRRQQGQASRVADERFVPGRDAGLITLKQIVDVIRREGKSPEDVAAPDALTVFARDLLQRSDAAAATVTERLTLSQAVARLEAGAAEADAPDVGSGS